MKPGIGFISLAACSLCGCQTYQYRIVEPATSTLVTDKVTAAVHYDPLDYRFGRYQDRLMVNVMNPTVDRVVLEGGRSFVVGPQGESHPLADRVLAPHSFIRLVLPPVPITYGYPDYWDWGPGWGWGPGWYDPFWSGRYGPWFYGPPAITYERIQTVYDWEWKSGPVRLRLSYGRNGQNFDHNFEIIRERAK